MLKRKYRINAGRFLEIMQKGKRKNLPFALIYRLETDLLGRIATSVPKKIEKSSVARHRVKRRFFHAFAKHSLPNADIVVIVKKGTQDLDFKTLVSETKNMLQ